jgi:hypothetical protein
MNSVIQVLVTLKTLQKFRIPFEIQIIIYVFLGNPSIFRFLKLKKEYINFLLNVHNDKPSLSRASEISRILKKQDLWSLEQLIYSSKFSAVETVFDSALELEKFNVIEFYLERRDAITKFKKLVPGPLDHVLLTTSELYIAKFNIPRCLVDFCIMNGKSKLLSWFVKYSSDRFKFTFGINDLRKASSSGNSDILDIIYDKVRGTMNNRIMECLQHCTSDGIYKYLSGKIPKYEFIILVLSTLKLNDAAATLSKRIKREKILINSCFLKNMILPNPSDRIDKFKSIKNNKIIAYSRNNGTLFLEIHDKNGTRSWIQVPSLIPRKKMLGNYQSSCVNKLIDKVIHDIIIRDDLLSIWVKTPTGKISNLKFCIHNDGINDRIVFNPII